MHLARLKRNGDLELHYAKKHGMKGTAVYKSWEQMKRRCVNPNHPRYRDYGGRGIKVCDRWLESFSNFYSDMKDKPSPLHSLDRIDNDGDYTPENCRWATKLEQVLNQRVRRDSKTGFSGITYTIRDKVYIAKYRKKYLGSFHKLSDAEEARQNAKSDVRDGLERMK